MNVHLARPPVGDLVFRLYGRPLHPELFEILATRTVERDGYQLTVRITRTGHLISWQSAELFLTEVTAAADQELPARLRLIDCRLRQEQNRERDAGRLQTASDLRVLHPDPPLGRDERAVLEKGGNRHDARAHLLVAHRDVEAFRFGERGAAGPAPQSGRSAAERSVPRSSGRRRPRGLSGR